MIERFYESIKYEHLFGLEIATGVELAGAIEDYRDLYNWVRPHETLGFARPGPTYTDPPAPTLRGHQQSEQL